VAVEGTLGVFRLPEILQLIAQQGKTGILTVQGPHDMVAISFLRGDIVYADALNQPAEEGLERVLVGDGMVRREDLARAAAEIQAGGGRLIDVLVERQHLSRPELLEALRLQTFRLLEQVLLWQEGDFKFFSGEEVSYEEGFAPIRVQDLLIRSVEDLEEEGRLSPPPPRPTLVPVPPEPARPPMSIAPHLVVPPPAPPPAAVEPRREAAVLLPEEPAVEPAAAAPAAGAAAVVRAPGWPAALLGAALAVALAAGLLLAPQRVLLPLPFQRGDRDALLSAQRASLYAKLDRAARTSFVLDGHFPERLESLRTRGLVGAADLRDPEGWPLAWQGGQEAYAVRPAAAAGPLAAGRGTIRGDFQLDPEFLAARPEGQAAQPLVLLD
jgi:Domain of unknown function (DUF4388)